MLPKEIYELIRWIIALFLPGLGVLVVSINGIWNLGWPAEEISLTLDAIGLFLGTIFGISKLVNDSIEEAENEEEEK